MEYVTALFKFSAYYPTVGFFIGLAWGFMKSGSNQPGSSGLAMSMVIGGAIGLVCGVALKYFAYYIQIH